MSRRDRTSERLIALFVLGAVLLLAPLLMVFNRPVRVFGLPVLYLYLFIAWALIIALCRAAVRGIEAPDDDRNKSAPADPPGARADAKDA